jgi:hypothetical protein
MLYIPVQRLRRIVFAGFVFVVIGTIYLPSFCIGVAILLGTKLIVSEESY